MKSPVKTMTLVTLLFPVLIGLKAFAADPVTSNPAVASTPVSATAPAAKDSEKDPIDQAAAGVADVLNDDDDGGPHVKIGKHFAYQDHPEKLEDIVIPIAAFLFVIVIVLGGRFMREQSARRRLDLLRLMIEKGQPISDAVVREMVVVDDQKKSSDPKTAHIKQLRNGLVLTGIGIALCLYRVIGEGAHHEKSLAIGLISLGLGLGLLISYKMSDKHFQS